MNKVLQVFTKEYKEETKYQLYLEKNINKMKFKSNNYNVEEKVKVLKMKNFNSNFKINSNIK